MKIFVFVVTVLPFLMVGCAHKQVGPSSSVESDTAVSATLEGEDQGTDPSESEKAGQQGGAPSEELAGDVDQPADAPNDDFDDDFFDEDLEDEEEVVEVSDPIIYFNKAMFHLNDKLYFWVLKPVGTVYKTILPEFVRISVKNFFHNLTFPVRFISSALQGKGERAQAELGRFMFNSTFGVLGLGNPAKRFDHLNPPKEDLGQTFGDWGIGEGFYLVLPVFGPSTLRDSVGLAGEFFFDPVTHLECWETRLVVNSTRVVNETSLRIGDYEAFKKAAIDPYTSMRDGYIQDRRKDVVE